MKKLKLEELGRKDVDAFRKSYKFPVILVLDNIRSALNIGSLFRIADAFALEAVLLVGISAQPPHKEIFKTALGSTESVNWKYFSTPEEAIEYLQKGKFAIIATEQTDESIVLDQFDWGFSQKYAFILGNEVNGVDERFLRAAQAAIEIPQYGTKHSLNVAVCGGIIAYQATLHLEK